MAATVWKGHLTFGLVSIPVRLVRAARAERVKLRQLYRRDPAADLENIQPAGSVSVAPLEGTYQTVERTYQLADGGGQPVSDAGLVKGHPQSKGEYVVLEEAEIRDITPEMSTEMEMVEFVPFDEIDPVYLETSYYVAPKPASSLTPCSIPMKCAHWTSSAPTRIWSPARNWNWRAR